MAGAAARWVLPLGLGGAESLVQQPAQRPGHKKPHHKDTTGDDCPRTAPHPVQ